MNIQRKPGWFVASVALALTAALSPAVAAVSPAAADSTKVAVDTGPVPMESAETPVVHPGSRARGFVVYGAPVDRPVVEKFRMDNGHYGAGNRGLKYDTDGGEAVRATASGLVTFSGQVAGRLAVTLRHADRRLSSVTGLTHVTVAVGDVVLAGDRIGTADRRLHFGIRQDGRYVDPALLISGSGLRRRGLPYLVPLGGTHRR